MQNQQTTGPAEIYVPTQYRKQHGQLKPTDVELEYSCCCHVQFI